MCHGLLCLLCMPLKCPIQNLWGNLLRWVNSGHFDMSELDFFWHHCTRGELLYTYQTRKATKQTQGRQYTIINLSFLIVFQSKCIGHAGIFAMNKV